MTAINSTYANRAAAGLCVRCGKKPPRPGRTRCTECARGDAEDQRQYAAPRVPQRREIYRAKRAADAKLYTCTVCGEKGHNRRTCSAFVRPNVDAPDHCVDPAQQSRTA